MQTATTPYYFFDNGKPSVYGPSEYYPSEAKEVFGPNLKALKEQGWVALRDGMIVINGDFAAKKLFDTIAGK